MNSKDNNIFNKNSLLNTKSGQNIIIQRLFKTKAYQQFYKYNQIANLEFPNLVTRFTKDLLQKIKNDNSPNSSQQKFIDKIDSKFVLTNSSIDHIKTKLENFNVLQDRVIRILDSNFVKMTLPVFNALYDASVQFYHDNDTSIRNHVIYGHIIAIDLSEPMDRIMDNDEDLDYLDDYKFMNPYILEIAMDNISKCGEKVLCEFEKGFDDAMNGQRMDYDLKSKYNDITNEKMNYCYKKYRAVIGTAGRNMTLCRKPLSEIFFVGMSKASESVGCGNEIEDSIKNNLIKTPSWPLYYSLLTNDIKQSFELTLRKSELYLDDAKLALETLPDNFSHAPFLEFLFLTVSHYNHFWYNKSKKTNSIKLN